jgi:hypothetical protein
MHVYRPPFYPTIAPGYPQPANATTTKWFRCDLHFSRAGRSRERLREDEPLT